MEVITPGTHGSTFGGNPLAMAVGLASYDEISKPETLANVNEIAGYLKQQLHGLAQRYPDVIVDVRGKGLLIGVKLVPNNREFMGWARDTQQRLVERDRDGIGERAGHEPQHGAADDQHGPGGAQERGLAAGPVSDTHGEPPHR